MIPYKMSKSDCMIKKEFNTTIYQDIKQMKTMSPRGCGTW